MRNLIATLGLQQNQVMNQGRQANQFGRLAKVKFPKFQGDDVRGWAFKCDQFFSINNSPNEEKVKIVSVHLSDKALLWHRQCLGANGDNAYSLTTLQETILEAVKKKSKPIENANVSRFRNGRCYGNNNKPYVLPFPASSSDEEGEYFEAEEGNEELNVQEEIPNFLECIKWVQYLPNNEGDWEAKKIDCQSRSTCPLAVTVRGGCEMVLGIQWLATLGDIKCNFKQLRIEFVYKGKRMTLRGTPKPALQWMERKRQNKEVETVPHAELLMLSVYLNTRLNLMSLQADSNELPKELKEIITTYEDVFEIPKELPPHRSHDHKIPLIEGNQPVNIRPYRHSRTLKDAIKAMVKELLDARVIKPSQSPFASPIVMTLSTYEKEFLAVLMALERWRCYLLDRHFIIKTNHYSLKYLLDQRITTPTQMKWLPKLMGFDYEVVYKKGSENGAADALSRVENSSELLQLFVSTVSTELMQKVKNSWMVDSTLNSILVALQNGLSTKKHYTLVNEQLMRKDKQVVGANKKLRKSLLHYFHDGVTGGHYGVKVTTHKLCSLFYWKGVSVSPYLLVLVSHGLPEYIVSDIDKVFISAFWKELFKTTPFEVVYDQPPPIHVPYFGGVSKVEAVDRSLVARENAIEVLKFHLFGSQNRMKQQADKGSDYFGKENGQTKEYSGGYALIQWTNGSREDATWERLEEIIKKYPDFNLASSKLLSPFGGPTQNTTIKWTHFKQAVTHAFKGVASKDEVTQEGKSFPTDECGYTSYPIANGIGPPNGESNFEEAVEFDPIKHHNFFCPWVNGNVAAAGVSNNDGSSSSSGGLALCGWQLTLDALDGFQALEPNQTVESESAASLYKPKSPGYHNAVGLALTPLPALWYRR
nr:zinc finger, C3HC [Tanacetum cinerariifolium]